MAKKIYLVDSSGVDFLTCEFDGMGSDNNPQLTIMTPGEPVVNFFTYLDAHGFEPKDYRLLCEEGKQADTTIVVEMMGRICMRFTDPYDLMEARMEEMRKNGISYDRDLQKLDIRIMETEDEDSGAPRYRVVISIGEKEHNVYNKNYKDVADIISKLKEFFYFIEEEMQIPLRKRLYVKAPLDKQLQHLCNSMFDEIVAIKKYR